MAITMASGSTREKVSHCENRGWSHRRVGKKTQSCGFDRRWPQPCAQSHTHQMVGAAWNTHTETHTYTHTHTYTQHTHRHTWTHTRTQTHKNMHMGTHTQMDTHRHTYTDIHRHAHTWTHTQTHTDAHMETHTGCRAYTSNRHQRAGIKEKSAFSVQHFRATKKWYWF